MIYLTILAISLICVALLAYTVWLTMHHQKDIMDERNKSVAERQFLIDTHAQERARWAAERKEFIDHFKYLNDRYLAKHAQDAVMMDRFPADAVPKEPREPRALIPEGL